MDEAAASRAAARLVRIATEALPPELAHLAAGPMAESLAKAVAYAQDSLCATTLKIYRDDWAAFAAWCAARGAPCLPAPPAIVAAYLAERSATLGRSALRLVLAAIAHHHRRAGQPWSSADPVLSSVMRGILRAQKRPVRPAAAITTEDLRVLLASCGAAEDEAGEDEAGGGEAGGGEAQGGRAAALAGLRDRALLLTGFAGGLRRCELVALEVHDVRFTADGLVLRIRHSKRDQEGEGADIGILHGRHTETCPVRALRTWLKRAGITHGPIFRKVTAAGTIERGLTGNGVWQILRRRAALAGFTVPQGERLSPHGLRAGFITEAYLNGALDEQVAHHARQTDLDTTRGYRRRAKTVAASPTRLLNL
jgi:integrase